MKLDYIIVGQGIAGSLLAHFLQRSGKKVKVFDDNRPSSSLVAIGLYNPIALRFAKLSWKAEELLPFSKVVYKELEQILNARFLHEMPLYRIFRSVKEQNDWFAKSKQAPFTEYMDMESNLDHNGISLDQGFGYGRVNGAGYLDLKVFLNAYRANLVKLGCFDPMTIAGNTIELMSDGVKVGDYQASHLIFCEGSAAAESRFFDIPLSPTKGELLELAIPAVDLKAIVHFGYFLVPTGGGVYRLGATFNWKEKDTLPTEDAKKHLLDKLKNIVKCPIEVLNQSAGLRPTIKDRRPVMGLHSKHPQLGIFNGMGTKGVLLAPYFAAHFTNYLLGKGKLDREVDLARFSS